MDPGPRGGGWPSQCPATACPGTTARARQAAGPAGACGLAGTGWAQLVLKNQAPPSAAHRLLHASASMPRTPAASLLPPHSRFSLLAFRGKGRLQHLLS